MISGPPCRWCGQAATGTVSAEGLTQPIPHCDTCWDRTYREVRGRIPRTWKLIEPDRTMQRRKRPQDGPDLLDLLPDRGETA